MIARVLKASMHEALASDYLRLARLKGLSGVRVLLVEDNELNSEIAVALLESLGAAAETAANGQEALDALD